MKRVRLCVLTVVALCDFAAAQQNVGESLKQAFGGIGSAIRERTAAPGASQKSSPAPAPAAAKPKVIVVSRAEKARPVRPNPKTTFVLANGERFDSDQYTIAAGTLQASVNGKQRSLPVSTLDMKTTIAVNHKRGVELKLPRNSSEVLLAF